MHALVTGGTGFIGRHLIRRLLADGVEHLSVLDNLSRGRAPDAENDRLQFIHGDVRDVRHVQSAMRDCEVVFHLAAEAAVMSCETRPQEAYDVNVTGTFNVLRAAREMGVRRVIFASSREVYGEATQLPVTENAPLRPKNAYGASKAAAEMYCSWHASAGLEVTVLRLANVFGSGDTGRVIPLFMAQAAAGRPLTIYGGGQIMDFVWIDHVITACVRAAFGQHVPGSVNIGSGVGVTLLQTAQRIVELYRSVSAIHYGPGREAEVLKFVADISRANLELGFRSSPDPLAPLTAMVMHDCGGRRHGAAHANAS